MEDKTTTVLRPNSEGFSLKCKNPQCIGGRIETTLDNDSGYSNWTVMDTGRIAFKCHGCGKYGSTYEYDTPNELSNFEVLCLQCPDYRRKDNNWDFSIGDVDEEKYTYIECKDCGQRVSGS